MKGEKTIFQTRTMAYEILNHAPRFSMAKQLTTKILRIRTSLPFADKIELSGDRRQTNQFCFLDADCLVVRKSQNSSRRSAGK